MNKKKFNLGRMFLNFILTLGCLALTIIILGILCLIGIAGASDRGEISENAVETCIETLLTDQQ